jgi:hypothetical protein
MTALALSTTSLKEFLKKSTRTAALLHVASLLMASCIIGHAAEADFWERLPKEAQLRDWVNLPTVPKADIYEVVPTKIDSAILVYLANFPLAVLTCSAADFLTGGHYNCDDNKKPILVRAVFANGGTGSFAARYDGKTLYVHHGSLSDNLGPTRNLPLIVNLPSAPTEVYSWASSAK